MSSEETEYFRMRALEERQRAVNAASPVVRAAHLEFAIRYEKFAGELNTAGEMRSSQMAVERSMDLLRNTDELVRGNDDWARTISQPS
jgi:hypothetical protein